MEVKALIKSVCDKGDIYIFLENDNEIIIYDKFYDLAKKFVNKKTSGIYQSGDNIFIGYMIDNVFYDFFIPTSDRMYLVTINGIVGELKTPINK